LVMIQGIQDEGNCPQYYSCDFRHRDVEIQNRLTKDRETKRARTMM
jgi:hypothetical protein